MNNDGQIHIHPDFAGLPPSIVHGLSQLTDNAAALVFLVAGVGIVVSAIGYITGHLCHAHVIRERSRSAFFVSISAGAILYAGVAAANYATVLFR